MRWRPRPLGVAAAGLVTGGLVLGGFGVLALKSPSPPLPAPAQQRAARPSALASSGPRPPASPPARIEIPSLGVSSVLGPPRGLTPAGNIDDAPLSGPTWALPWWYDGGPAPGQPGSAVILGHVNSAVGAGHLGVFFRLGALESGQTVTVALADGAVTHWVVESDVVYPDAHFPDAVVYARSGPRTLRLVTCGGTYNWSTHLYESAVVVTARLVSVSNTH